MTDVCVLCDQTTETFVQNVQILKQIIEDLGLFFGYKCEKQVFIYSGYNRKHLE